MIATVWQSICLRMHDTAGREPLPRTHPLGAMQNIASRMASWYRCHSGGFRRQPLMLRGASSSAMSCRASEMRFAAVRSMISRLMGRDLHWKVVWLQEEAGVGAEVLWRLYTRCIPAARHRCTAACTC